MNKNKFFYEIKVVNLDTDSVYFHSKVPCEHLEMLKLNPNLEIDILGHYREGGYENEKTKYRNYKSNSI